MGAVTGMEGRWQRTGRSFGSEVWKKLLSHSPFCQSVSLSFPKRSWREWHAACLGNKWRDVCFRVTMFIVPYWGPEGKIILIFILLSTRGLFQQLIPVKGQWKTRDKQEKEVAGGSKSPTLFWCSPHSPGACVCSYSNRESDGGGIIKGNAVETVT